MTSQNLSLLDTKDQRQDFAEKIKREARTNAPLVSTVTKGDPIMIFNKERVSEQQQDLTTMIDQPEVDSRDAPPVTRGIHLMQNAAPSPSDSSESSLCSSADNETDDDADGAITTIASLEENALSSSSSSSTVGKYSKLTLSAFRRPEQTIRLTKSNPNRRLGAEYDLHGPGCRVLGHGAFSTVRLAVRKCDGVEVAVKTIAKHEALRSRRLRIGGRRDTDEWEILHELQTNPYVINLLDVYETDEEIQIVMEYCRGGELFDAIQKKRNEPSNSLNSGRYTEAQAAHITSQILRALVDLHGLGIVHRDIKAENILLTSDDIEDYEMLHVKLCDFGMARAVYQSNGDGEASPITPGIGRSYSIVGSNYYMAPEVGTGVSYSTSMDIFSMGVTLYILLCGFPPVFTGNDDSQSEVMFPNVFWKDISVDAKNLVKKMLNPVPDTRISAREALKDPWIVKNIVTSAKQSRLSKSMSRRSSIDNTSKLELVRNCLYKNLAHKTKRASAYEPTVVLPKRKRPRRASSCLMALADLYREVATPPGGNGGAAAPTITPPGPSAIHPNNAKTSGLIETAAKAVKGLSDVVVEGERRSSLAGPQIPALSV